MLSFPVPTICAINGHYLAGGFMFAVSHDVRIGVDSPRVKMGMTEINIGLNIPRAMMAPLLAKLNSQSLRDINLFGISYSPQ